MCFLWLSSRSTSSASVFHSFDHRIHRRAHQGRPVVHPLGNIIAGEASAMAWVPLTIDRQLGNRAKQDGRRVFFDSNTGFVLPNGANRSPDASWILRPRSDALTPAAIRVCTDLPGLCYRAMVAKRYLEQSPVQAGRVWRKWRETRIFDLSATTERLRLSFRPRPATSGQSSIRAG